MQSRPPQSPDSPPPSLPSPPPLPQVDKSTPSSRAEDASAQLQYPSAISDQPAPSTASSPASVTLPAPPKPSGQLPVPEKAMPGRVEVSHLVSRLAEENRFSGLPQAHPSPPPPIAILPQSQSQSPSLSSSSLDRSTGPSPAPGHPAAPATRVLPHPSSLPMHVHPAHAYSHPYDPIDRRMYPYPQQDHHYRAYQPQTAQHLSMAPYPPPAHIVPSQLTPTGHHDVGYPYPGRDIITPVFTDDATTKLSDRVRRRCFNCCTTDTSTWRRSSLNPGKVLCNKCGLFERTHSRPRPEQFPHKRGPLATSSLRARTSPTQLHAQANPQAGSLPSVNAYPPHPYAHPGRPRAETLPQVSSGAWDAPAPAHVSTPTPAPAATPAPQVAAPPAQTNSPAASAARTPPEPHRRLSAPGTVTPLRTRSP